MTTTLKATQFDKETERRLDLLTDEFNAAADAGDETAAQQAFDRAQALMNSARRMMCADDTPLPAEPQHRVGC